MSKKIYPFYLISAFFLGIVGAVLRAYQLVSAFDPETGLPIHGASATLLLFIAFAVIAAAGAVFAFKVQKDFEESISPSGENLIKISFSVSAVIVLVFAFLKFLELRDGLVITTLILALFSVYCSVSLFALGKYKMAERSSVSYCIFASVPVFWACYLIVLLFREKIPDPIVLDYVFSIFSYILVLMIAYGISANVLGKGRRRLTSFVCFIGMAVMMTELLSPLAGNLFFGGEFEFSLEKLSEWLPILAFLVLIPAVSGKVSRR